MRIVTSSVNLELLLHREMIWLLFIEILPPPVAAKLLVQSYPVVEDAFIVAHLLVSNLAASRGLLTPKSLGKFRDLLEFVVAEKGQI